MKTIHDLDWNIGLLKKNDFNWFKMKVNGYAENGQVEKPKEYQLKSFWEKITGKKVKVENDKK